MDATIGSSLREKNTQERRAGLVDAAYALFREKGYAATTMDEVSVRAGLSRRTAFRYFTSKEDLVFPRRNERLSLLSVLLVPREGETPFETVRRACLGLARHYQEDRAHMLAQFRIVASEPSLLGRELQFDRRSEEAIEGAFAAGQGSTRTQRRARVRAAAVLGVVRATLREWLEGGATGDLVRLGRETFADLEHGFGDTSE